MQAKITWSPVTNAPVSGYTVEFTNNGKVTTSNVPSTATAAGYTVNFSDQLSVRVRANNAGGPGVWSEPVVITAPAPPPQPEAPADVKIEILP